MLRKRATYTDAHTVRSLRFYAAWSENVPAMDALDRLEDEAAQAWDGYADPIGYIDTYVLTRVMEAIANAVPAEDVNE